MELGAKVNKKTADGLTCLHLAVHSREDNVPEIFSKRSARDSKKIRILANSCDHAHKSMVKMLLAKGADINAMDSDGLTPLDCCECNCDIKKILIRELARKRYENEKIGRENLRLIKESKQVKALFDKCVRELESLNQFEFENGYSLYDIYQVRNDRKAVAFLMKGQSFDIDETDLRDDYENYGSEIEDALIDF